MTSQSQWGVGTILRGGGQGHREKGDGRAGDLGCSLVSFSYRAESSPELRDLERRLGTRSRAGLCRGLKPGEAVDRAHGLMRCPESTSRHLPAEHVLALCSLF